jgi:hypothetical protein
MRLTLQTKAEPINRDVAIMLGDLSRPDQARRFAEVAAMHIADAKSINRVALGREPRSTTFVDGRRNAPLRSVRPDGMIHVEFELLLDVLIFIGRTLEQFSPVKSGRYRKSHHLFADGVEMNIDTPALQPQLMAASEFVFVNSVPYARKIERGMSSSAPNGVYQATATLARRRFGNIARITFSFRSLFGGTGGAKSERQPAIIVRVG